MIGRQVYRRGELRVEFPQLEKPISEFRTARKRYGNLKNEGSPEFRVGSRELQPPECSSKSKASFESFSTRPSQNQSSFEPDVRRTDSDPSEALEIELLKEELRRRDEEIRKLLSYDRSLTPVAPQTKSDPVRSLTPLKLYQMGQQQSPSVKPKSVSPYKGEQRNQSVFVANGTLVAQKESMEMMSVHELARLPQFQQPKFTTKHPKVHADNPITGLPRVVTDDVRRGFADYGNMLISPLKGNEQSAHRKML